MPVFFCDSAIDARRGLYYKLNWEKHHSKALQNVEETEGTAWTVVAKDTKTLKRPSRVKEESSDDEESADDYRGSASEESDSDASQDTSVASEDGESIAASSDDEAQRTPRKRKGVRAMATPRKRTKTTLAAPTPHSKAALKARQKRSKRVHLPRQDQAYNYLDLHVDNLPEDPWLRVLQVLHVGSRPDVLPCRDGEFNQILGSVEALLEEGSGGCICKHTFNGDVLI